MSERREEIARYGLQVLISTDLVIAMLPEEERAKQVKVLEQVGRKMYAKLVGLVTVILKERGLPEGEAIQEATRQVGGIVFGEDEKD